MLSSFGAESAGFIIYITQKTWIIKSNCKIEQRHACFYLSGLRFILSWCFDGKESCEEYKEGVKNLFNSGSHVFDSAAYMSLASKTF